MYSIALDLRGKPILFSIPQLVQTACRYESRLMIHNNQGEFSPKSIMGMMTIDMHDGKLLITAEGPDEQEAGGALYMYMSGESAVPGTA